MESKKSLENMIRRCFVKELGESQSMLNLAMRSGISRQMIQRFLQGTHSISVKHVDIFLTGLNITLEDLMSEYGEEE